MRARRGTIVERLVAPSILPEGSHACARFERAKPLSVEALWSSASARRRSRRTVARVRAGDVVRHGHQRGHDRALAVSRPARGGSACAKPRRLTAGDKDSDPRWSPDGRCDRVHREAQGRRRAADLPDRARRRRGATRLTDIATGASAIKWFPDGKRIAFVSWVWPDLDDRRGAGEAHEGAQGREGQGARDRARASIRFWDHWLTDGREPHVFVCDVATGRVRDVLAGTGIALQPWEPHAEHYDIAPDGREIALTVDPGAEPRMMNQCDIVVVDLATGRVRNLPSDERHVGRAPALFAGRHATRRITRTTRSARSTTRDICACSSGARGALRALAPRLDRATQHVAVDAPTRARSCSLIEDRGRVGLWRLAARRATRPTPLVAAAARSAASRSSRDGGVHRVRRARPRCIRLRSSRAAATAAASARSRR